MIPVLWMDVERGQTPSPGVFVLGYLVGSPKLGKLYKRYALVFWHIHHRRLFDPLSPTDSFRYWIDLPAPPEEVR